MSKNKRLLKPIAIAVEGADWFYLLLNQIKNKSEFEHIQLFDFAGISQLGSFLSLLRRDRKFEQLKALGIMRDAELDREAAVTSLQTTLRHAGFAAPDAPNQISTTPVPAVAYLVIPHDEPSGCLENAILKAHIDEEISNCVTAFLHCVDPTSQRTANEQAKMKVRAIIAASKVPGMTLGESANVGLWNWNHPSLRIMVDFIRLVRDAAH